MNKLDSTQPEHIDGPARPIMAAIVPYSAENKAQLRQQFARASNIEYEYSSDQMVANNCIGETLYVTSQLDEKDKCSCEYFNCVAVVLVGTSKETGKEISVLTHSYPFDPTAWAEASEENESGEEENFLLLLDHHIQNIKQNSIEGSIDIVIAGGNYSRELAYVDHVIAYKQTIRKLSDLIFKKSGITPTIIAGPQDVLGATDIYFDTQNRRLFILRENPQDFSKNESFLPSELEDVTRHWDETTKKPSVNRSSITGAICRKIARYIGILLS